MTKSSSPSSFTLDRPLYLLIISAVLTMIAFLSLLIGPASISALNVFSGLFGYGDETIVIIVQQIRLPRTMLGLMIGATLGLSGAALQGFTRNPLASPSLIGTSNAAAFGASAVLYVGAAGALSLWLPFAAIISAFVSATILLALVSRDGRIVTLILAGLALSSFASALTALLLNLAPDPFAALEIAFWLLGSLADRSMVHVALAAPFMLLSWIILWRTRLHLQALTLGRDVAVTLGTDPKKLSFMVVGGTALGVGAAVAVSGVVGFVGLVVPHIVRPLVGYDPGRTLFPSALFGALLLLGADILVRLIPTYSEMKLGVITALIGVPFFFILVFRERQFARSEA